MIFLTIWLIIGALGFCFAIWTDVNVDGNDVAVKDVLVYGGLGLLGPVIWFFILIYIINNWDWGWLQKWLDKPVWLAKEKDK